MKNPTKWAEPRSPISAVVNPSVMPEIAFERADAAGGELQQGNRQEQRGEGQGETHGDQRYRIAGSLRGLIRRRMSFPWPLSGGFPGIQSAGRRNFVRNF